MALDVATLGIKIDASGALSTAAQVEGALGKITKAAAALGLTLGAGALFDKFIKNSIEAQNAMAQLEQRVKSTGGAAGFSARQLDEYSLALQRVSTYSDEAIKGAQTMLLTFRNIRGAEFSQATQAVMDLATAMGTDLQGAAIQVGKALQDPEQGLLALRRSGVSFSEAQQKVIKDLFATGEVATAQRMILQELQVEFGGAAEAARNTLGGSLSALKEEFGNVFEVSRDASGGIVDFINAITKALPGLREQIIATFGGFRLLWLDLQVGIQNFNAKVYSTFAAMASGFASFLKLLPGTQQSVKELTDAAASLNQKAGILRDGFAAWKAEQEGIITGTERLAKALVGVAGAGPDAIKVVDDLLTKTKQELADANKQIAFAETHRSLLVEIAQRKAEINALDAINLKIAQDHARIASVGFGTVNTTKIGTLSTPLDIGKAPGASNPLGINYGNMSAYDAALFQYRLDAEGKYENTLAAERAKIYKNFLRGMQEAFAKTFENIFTHGLSGFKDLFQQIGNLIASAAAQMASSGLTNWVTGKYNAGAANGGGWTGGIGNVISSANPLAVFTVATTAVVSFGNSLARAAKALDDARNAWLKDLQTQNALAAQTSSYERERAEIEAARIKKIDELVQLLLKTRNLEFANPANFLSAPSGAQRDLLVQGRAAAQSKYDQFGGESFKRMIEAFDDAIKIFDELQKATDRANRELEERIRLEREDTERSLKARELRALGLNDEADALELFNRQVQEFRDAVAKGWSMEMLQWLSGVQQLERDQLKAAQTAQKAADAQKALANAQQMAAEAAQQVAEVMQKIADAVAEAKEKLGLAVEDLNVRMLRATGQMAEADRKAFALQQQREIRDAEKELRATKQEMLDLGIGRPWYLDGGSVIDGIMYPTFNPWWQQKYGSNANLIYKEIQNQKPFYDSLIEEIKAYIENLKKVQDAEKTAFENGQSTPGATAANPLSPSGSFGTIVSRATSAQGDRMVDLLTTSTVYLKEIADNTRATVAKLSGGVDALLGSSLQSAQAFAGSSLVA